MDQPLLSIAISGPSGTGKSYLAKEIAHQFNLLFADSPTDKITRGSLFQLRVLNAFMQQRIENFKTPTIYSRAFIDTAAYNAFCSYDDEQAAVRKYSQLCIAADSLYHDLVIVMPFTGSKPKLYDVELEYQVHMLRLGLVDQLDTVVYKATTYGDAKLTIARFIQEGHV